MACTRCCRVTPLLLPLFSPSPPFPRSPPLPTLQPFPFLTDARTGDTREKVLADRRRNAFRAALNQQKVQDSPVPRSPPRATPRSLSPSLSRRIGSLPGGGMGAGVGRDTAVPRGRDDRGGDALVGSAWTKYAGLVEARLQASAHLPDVPFRDDVYATTRWDFKDAITAARRAQDAVNGAAGSGADGGDGLDRESTIKARILRRSLSPSTRLPAPAVLAALLPSTAPSAGASPASVSVSGGGTGATAAWLSQQPPQASVSRQGGVGSAPPPPPPPSSVPQPSFDGVGGTGAGDGVLSDALLHANELQRRLAAFMQAESSLSGGGGGGGVGSGFPAAPAPPVLPSRIWVPAGVASSPASYTAVGTSGGGGSGAGGGGGSGAAAVASPRQSRPSLGGLDGPAGSRRPASVTPPARGRSASPLPSPTRGSSGGRVAGTGVPASSRGDHFAAAAALDLNDVSQLLSMMEALRRDVAISQGYRH